MMGSSSTSSFNNDVLNRKGRRRRMDERRTDESNCGCSDQSTCNNKTIKSVCVCESYNSSDDDLLKYCSSSTSNDVDRHSCTRKMSFPSTQNKVTSGSNNRSKRNCSSYDDDDHDGGGGGRRKQKRWRNTRLTIGLYILMICLMYLTMVKEVESTTEEDWSAKCPSSCQCKWISGKKTAECKDAGYKSIPTGFSDELQVLNLERNSITSLTKEVFKSAGLLNLQKIHLKNNKIERVHKDAFRDLQILIELDLSENKISTIDMESFETNARLRELYLYSNPITKLSGVQFPRLEQFKILDLKDCKLSQLSRKSFEKLTNLEFLDLSGNLFQYISVDILQPLVKLKSLNLQRNPWRCDCRLKSFRDWTKERKLIQSGVTCAQPDNLANFDWVKLLTDNFACKPEIRTLQISGQAASDLIVGDVGKNITLECLVYANPPANVRWMRDGTLVNNSTTTRTYMVHISGETDRWVNLTILRSNPNDAGEYTCVGENPGGMVEKNLTLNFQDVPFGAGVGVGNVGEPGSHNKSLFWILLGVVGALVILTMAIMLICLCSRRRRVKTARSQDMKGAQLQPLVDNHHESGVRSDPSSPQRQGPGDGTTPLLTKSFLKPEEDVTDYPDILDSHRRTQDSPAGSSSASTVPDPTRLIMPQQLNPAELYDPTGNPIMGLPYGTPIHYHPHLMHPGLGRPHSPYSGSVASFTSEPPQAIIPPANRPGYVTLPRRPRVPSWSPGTHASNYPSISTPLAPSPTGSSVTTAGYPYVKYDNLGPRTTADGSSKLSLNKVGVDPPAMAPTPHYYGGTLPHTSKSPAFRPAPLMPHQHSPGSPFFNFAPIQENDGPTTPTEAASSGFPETTPLATLPRSWRPSDKSPPNHPLVPKTNGGLPQHRVYPQRPLSTPTEKKVPPKPPPKPSKKNSTLPLIEDTNESNEPEMNTKIRTGEDGTEV